MLGRSKGGLGAALGADAGDPVPDGYVGGGAGALHDLKRLVSGSGRAQRQGLPGPEMGRAVPLGFGKACGGRAEIARVARIATDCFAHDNADAKGSSENRCYELGDEAPGWRGARRRNTRRIATTSNDASRDGSSSKSLQIFSDEP